MPKTPIDYSKAVIYKIQHNDIPELLYIGSTTDFIRRKCSHKSNVDNPKNTYKIKLYEMIRNNGGWDCFNVIIVKDYPCQNNTVLLIEEDKCMRELKASLNMKKAHQTEQERVEKKRELDKANSKLYYIKHKERINTTQNEKILCECGGRYTRVHKHRHLNSKKHLSSTE